MDLGGVGEDLAEEGVEARALEDEAEHLWGENLTAMEDLDCA